jgi:hypothetical protein
MAAYGYGRNDRNRTLLLLMILGIFALFAFAWWGMMYFM